jgi:hypothetical protein
MRLDAHSGHYGVVSGIRKGFVASVLLPHSQPSPLAFPAAVPMALFLVRSRREFQPF